jgi:hypothetical protein
MHSITISDSHVQYAILALLAIGAAAGLLYIRVRFKTYDKAIEGLRKELGLLLASAFGKDTLKAPVQSSEPKPKTWTTRISKWKVGLVLVIVALIVVIFIPKDDESNAHRGKIMNGETVKVSAPAADKEEAPSAKNDACGKCKVEKVPDDQLTAEKSGDGWKFFGHKCVGSPACEACEVDNCTGAYDDRPPTGPCNHCSLKK